MPRNRQIKAEFWSDEKIGNLSVFSRLLFIGLWNFADDSGICRANPVFLKNKLFPYDHNLEVKEVDKSLNELLMSNLIKFINHNNEKYLWIVNFLKHQKINRPSKFRYIEIEGDDYHKLFKDSVSTHTPLNEQSLLNVNVNDNVNEFNEKIKVKKFNKPSLKEVEELFIKRGIDGELGKSESEIFYTTYENKNWMMGDNKMRDLKSSIDKWIEIDMGGRLAERKKEIKINKQRYLESGYKEDEIPC